MQTCLFSSASSATNPPFNEYYNSYSRCPESCSSRSSSPWSDMTSSIQRENDIDMTDSPATSYASFEQLSAESPYSGECEEVSSRHSSGSSASLSVYTPSSSHGIHLHSEPRRKAAKNAYVASKDLESVTRAVRVRELKEKALRINKGGSNKAPCPDLQRDVLRMVFDQITPYPDEAWIAQLALHFNCRYDKIKNWFSNNRQKDASEHRALHPKGKYDLAATLRQINCEGRLMRLRPSALEHCKAEEWTDNFFYEVVLINAFRMKVKEVNDTAHREAAYVMLDIKMS